MRIIFDYQIFQWQKFGGVSRYAYELALKLSSSYDQDVTVVCPLHINEYLHKSRKDLNVIGFLAPVIPKGGRLYRLINIFLASVIMRCLRPEIVHETYYSARRVAPKRAKVILTVYDMIHERFKEQFSPSDSTTIKKAIAVERADHIICISDHTRRDLIDLFGVTPSKISVVYLGFALTVDLSTIQKLDSLNRPFLLYVGGRHGYKNFEGLLKAYANSNRLKSEYDLICFGGGAFSIKEIKMIEKLNLPIDSIRQVSGNDDILGRYYRSASLFVYPSFYEGFGIPPLEAMSYDCPVVCSNVSSIPEVVGDAALFFNPTEFESIQFAIEHVLEDSNLRNELISRGREQIKKFSWEKCAKETLDIYKKVIK